MRISQIDWDPGSIAHIARHGVEPKEVEEVFFKGSPYTVKARHNRYIAFGQAESGRYLAVIFSYLGQNKAGIITARAMSEPERRAYRRK